MAAADRSHPRVLATVAALNLGSSNETAAAVIPPSARFCLKVKKKGHKFYLYPFGGILRFWRFFRGITEFSTVPVLEKRLKELEERWSTIETEWTEWYEKFRLLHLRLAHRQKALEKSEAQTTSAQADTSNGGDQAQGSLPSMHPGLTDAQKEIQQKILRNRARM
jgi:hypothetical protein